MSGSVRPHRRQPTRLRCPWDSPGKNTGVGCHFLLQCRKVKSQSEVAQLCPSLSDPTHCSLPGSSVHGIFQARVLEWVAIAFTLARHNSYLTICRSCLTTGGPGKELGINNLPPTRKKWGKDKCRDETPVYISSQFPRILLAEIHLG